LSGAADGSQRPPVTVRLWDWPVRVCHWGMVLLLPALWWTGEEGELEWHRWLGLAMLFFVLLRVIWGFIGSQPARFAGFLRGPGAVLAYLQGKLPAPLGHNPLGGWSVAALLGILSLQLGLGLVAQDEYAVVAGPLNPLVTYETAEAATEWHERLFNGILALVALHIAAVLFYLIARRTNLIGPMLTGCKAVDADTAQPRMASPPATLAALALAIGVTLWIACGAPPF
jgi:cytochrome b